MLGEINLWGLVGAALINFFLGMIWYSPKLFGRIWTDGTGIKESDAQNYGIGVLIGSFLNSLLMALGVAVFLFLTNSQTVLDAVIVAFFAWLGFILTTQIAGLLWEKRPLSVFFVNAGYRLLALILMGIFLILV